MGRILDALGAIGCITMGLCVILFNIFAGMYIVNYDLGTFFNAHLEGGWLFFTAIILAEPAATLAIFAFILRIAGVHTPILH